MLMQGVMRLQSPAYGGSWLPVFSAADVKGLTGQKVYWPIGLNTENFFFFVCSIEDPYPKASPSAGTPCITSCISSCFTSLFVTATHISAAVTDALLSPALSLSPSLCVCVCVSLPF